MSTYAVVPDSIISTAASRVPTRTSSGDTVLASAGKMYFCSQSISARSSARPRYITIGACVCVLIKPGQDDLIARVDRLAPPDTSRRSPPACRRRRCRCRRWRPRRASGSGARRSGDHRAAGDDQRHPPPRRLRATTVSADHDQRQRSQRAISSDGRFIPRALSRRAAAPSLYSHPVPVHIVDHPLVHDALATLRDKTTTPEHFRRAATRISVLLVAEALSDVPPQRRHRRDAARSGAGRRTGSDVVVVPVLRAGLGMLDAVLELVPSARVGHIGLQRDEMTAVASQYYSKLPSRLDASYVLMIDPMLATGGSAVAALDLLQQAGAKVIRMICIVAAPEGRRAGRAASSGRRDLHAGRRRQAQRAQIHRPRTRRLRRPAVRHALKPWRQQDHAAAANGARSRARARRPLAVVRSPRSRRTRSSCAATRSTR